MAITREESQEQIIEALGLAIEHIALAVECLGEAFEQLSDSEGERLEADLFGPVQKGYGRARRTRDGFAQRVGMRPGPLTDLIPGPRSQGAKSFVERAEEAAGEADRAIAELQDTMLPIEAGDPELRAGLAEVREQLAGVPVAAREFLRTLGR